MATAIKKVKVKEQGGTFRLLVGDHLDFGPPGCECEDCLRSGGRDHRYQAKRYNQQTGEPIDGPDYDGDLIESKHDLEARFNKGPFSRKFERVYQDRPTFAALVQPNLEAMSVKELQELAQDQEIDISGAKTKEDLLRILRRK